jgi:uncharacterized membrane protein YeaQ/YmgE (transglycosylase-associated protein family)
MVTNVVAWIVIGAIAGWLASLVVRGAGYGLIGDIIVGIVGALIGGYLSTLFGGPGFTGFNVVSFIIAFIGACILLFLLRVVARGTRRGAHL